MRRPRRSDIADTTARCGRVAMKKKKEEEEGGRQTSDRSLGGIVVAGAVGLCLLLFLPGCLALVLPLFLLCLCAGISLSRLRSSAQSFIKGEPARGTAAAAARTAGTTTTRTAGTAAARTAGTTATRTAGTRTTRTAGTTTTRTAGTTTKAAALTTTKKEECRTRRASAAGEEDSHFMEAGLQQCIFFDSVSRPVCADPMTASSQLPLLYWLRNTAEREGAREGKEGDKGKQPSEEGASPHSQPQPSSQLCQLL